MSSADERTVLEANQMLHYWQLSCYFSWEIMLCILYVPWNAEMFPTRDSFKIWFAHIAVFFFFSFERFV